MPVTHPSVSFKAVLSQCSYVNSREMTWAAKWDGQHYMDVAMVIWLDKAFLLIECWRGAVTGVLIYLQGRGRVEGWGGSNHLRKWVHHSPLWNVYTLTLQLGASAKLCSFFSSSIFLKKTSDRLQTESPNQRSCVYDIREFSPRIRVEQKCPLRYRRKEKHASPDWDKTDNE